MVDLNLGLGAPNTDFEITPAEDKKPFFSIGSPRDMVVEEEAIEVTFTAQLDRRYGGAATSFQWFINEAPVPDGEMSDDNYTLSITSDIDVETDDHARYKVLAKKEDVDPPLETMSRTATLTFDTTPYQYNYQYNHQYA